MHNFRQHNSFTLTLVKLIFATHLRINVTHSYIIRQESWHFRFPLTVYLLKTVLIQMLPSAYDILLTIIMVSGARCRYFGEVPRETVGANRRRCVQRQTKRCVHRRWPVRVLPVLQRPVGGQSPTAVVRVAGDEHQVPDDRTAQHVPGGDEHQGAGSVPEGRQHVVAAVRSQNLPDAGN